MRPTSESGRVVARAAAAAFGGRPEVRRFYDAGEVNSVDLLSCADRPALRFATYSTVDLHEVHNILNGSDVRVEVAGVAAASIAEFPNVISTSALYIKKNHWLCAPG